MEGTKKNRQQQAAESKGRLVEAAMELFQKNGYEQTTVQDICRRAELSVGVFYHYFPSKAGILQTVRGQKSQELMTYIRHESYSKNHEEAILELLGFVVRQQSSGDPELVRNAFATAALRGFEQDQELFELCSRVIKSAQLAEEFNRTISAETICADLLTASRGLVYRWCECGGSFNLEQEHQGYLRRLLRAYKQTTD